MVGEGRIWGRMLLSVRQRIFLPQCAKNTEGNKIVRETSILPEGYNQTEIKINLWAEICPSVFHEIFSCHLVGMMSQMFAYEISGWNAELRQIFRLYTFS